MPSERVTLILLSKTDMSREQIEQLSESQAWGIIYANGSGQKRVSDHRFQICFTGFNDSKRIEMTEIAEKANFKVVTSVTKKLTFLCTGENPGPTKLEKAHQQGVQILDESEFIALTQTGEIPSR